MIDLKVKTFDGIVKAYPVILVDFSAMWCTPCRAMGQILDKLARAMPDLPVGKVDIDSDLELATRFSIAAVPTMILMVDGTEVARKVGVMPLAQLTAWVHEHQTKTNATT